ncbi:DnaA ATPase domain-containing protein [Ligilactobacillus salivarius]|uniref:DnaA ATPase domain-containing protein n=1 Tax=Ligilactobacillus salivarius TaxID=1624 RepID=UPI0022E984D5|nr:DnaA/Hda family protein [Ligilactobacillus salivarius]
MAIKTTGDIFSQMMKRIFIEVGDCPQCGGKLLVPKAKQTVPPTCPTCAYSDRNLRKNNTEETWSVEAQKNKATGAFLDNSILPSLKMMGATFNNLNLYSNDIKEVARIAKDIANRISKPQHSPVHSLFSGSSGRGKTRIAVSIINEVWRLTGYKRSVVFIDYPLLVSTQRLGINDSEARKKVDKAIHKAKQADLLIVDDIGTESQMNSGWNKEVFNEIMRFREDKDVIVTTNVPPKELVNLYSEQTISRLRKHARGNYILFKDSIKDYRSVAV